MLIPGQVDLLYKTLLALRALTEHPIMLNETGIDGWPVGSPASSCSQHALEKHQLLCGKYAFVQMELQNSFMTLVLNKPRSKTHFMVLQFALELCLGTACMVPQGN